MAILSFEDLVANAKAAGIDQAIITMAENVLAMGLDSAARKILTEKLADVKSAASDVDHIAAVKLFTHEALGTYRDAETKKPTLHSVEGILAFANVQLTNLRTALAAYNAANTTKLVIAEIDGKLQLRGGKRTRVGGAQFDWSGFAKMCRDEGITTLYFPQGKGSDGKRIGCDMRVTESGNAIVRKPASMPGSELWESPTMVGKHITGWKAYGALKNTTVLVDGKHIAVDAYHSALTGQEIEGDDSENEIGSEAPSA